MTIDEVIVNENKSVEARMKMSSISITQEATENNKRSAEYHKQIVGWLEELKALRLLLEWSVECNFGLDCFEEEYEMYKHTITDDMSYTDMMIQIAKCVNAEQLKGEK